MTYKFTGYGINHKDGSHRVEIGYRNGFWRWLFRIPERIETYTSQTGFYGTWIDRATNQFANARKQVEIDDVVSRVKRLRFGSSYFAEKIRARVVVTDAEFAAAKMDRYSKEVKAE